MKNATTENDRKDYSELHPLIFSAKNSCQEATILKNFYKELPSLADNKYLIDTHCHLDMESYSQDRDEIIENAEKNGIKRIVTIGIDIPSSERAIALSHQHSHISATIGIHPHDINNINRETYRTLEKLASEHSSQIVGYGEIGLDYVKQYSPIDSQQLHFAQQLDFANELDLPVIIHNREANSDTLAIIKKAKPFTNGGIMHCFSGDYEFAKKVIDLGLLVSIPGIVTFKNAKVLQEVAQKIPLTSMVIETDGPFLTPHPYRGKRNEPLLLLHTANKIAQLRNISIDEVANQTSLNAENLFSF